jgi:hypothetical protein
MKEANAAPMILTAQLALVATALLAAGCASHPDDKAAVYAALDKSNLSSVTVSQDRHSGILTLTGIVANGRQKSQAETLAGQAAPGYTVRDRIQVKPTGA